MKKTAMTSQFSDRTSSLNFFSHCFVSQVKFSYWSKVHVNIITGSGVMTIYFYKGLTRNLKIGNTPSEFCPITGNWEVLWIPNLLRTSLIKCYWMLQNTVVTGSIVFKLWRENQQGRGGGGCEITQEIRP